MANDILILNDDSFSNYLKSFADLFAVEIVNNSIHIPSHAGKGFIKYIHLEAGLGIRYYNFVLNNNLEYNKYYDDEKELLYRVLYILPDDVNSDTNDRNMITMYTSEVQTKGYIKKNEHFHQIVIVFDASWLEHNNLQVNTKIGRLSHTLAKNNMPVMFSKEFSQKSRNMTLQLARCLCNHSLPRIEIKMNCLILINNFLNKIIELEDPKVLSGDSNHFETILNIEKKIINNLTKPLPSMQELASEFNLSVSTLQRHFKMVFGKNIFEYHQEKRILWGKREIENGNKSISQIAYELGFMKVNNFSKAFRKQFYILPRDLKFRKAIS